jgi:hypothetical protein
MYINLNNMQTFKEGLEKNTIFIAIYIFVSVL